jgi:hypothetical protein
MLHGAVNPTRSVVDMQSKCSDMQVRLEFGGGTRRTLGMGMAWGKDTRASSQGWCVQSESSPGVNVDGNPLVLGTNRRGWGSICPAPRFLTRLSVRVL